LNCSNAGPAATRRFGERKEKAAKKGGSMDLFECG